MPGTPKARRAAVDRYRKRHPGRVAASQKKTRDAWKLRDPEGWERYRKEGDLKRKGLTVDEYDAMIAAHAGRCAICRTVFTVPAIDHDHRCCPQNRACKRCLRGLLCRRCNLGLGHFMDSPELLHSAANYLGLFPGEHFG